MTKMRIQRTFAVLVGFFIFFTAASGPFEGLIQRAVFLALVIPLGLSLYPLGAGKFWHPLGVMVDLVLIAVSWTACAYVIVNYDKIMTTLPWATVSDKVLTCGLVLTILELARRTVGLIFPLLVIAGLGYALFGNMLPGALKHRGFDSAFVTETIFLGDLGIWGMLTGVASTVIAAFVLFGTLLLHSGGGQTFMDLAVRLGGRQPGGAAKIATIASGMFGTISGSAVANVATTGNFTIPMMINLGYPRSFAAAVEAVASTGGQIAPPIMGAAAFVMAEILGVSYLKIITNAFLPAVLFYISVFVTVHFVAKRRKLAVVPSERIPSWNSIMSLHRILPIICAMGGLGVGVYLGRSIATAAYYGIIGLLIAFVCTQVKSMSPKEMLMCLVRGLEDAGKGMVIIGVLLAGAQVLVSMINLTGVGVTLSSLIVSLAGDSAIIISIIVGIVCLVMGMGLPTTAAYVLVAAVLAPAMTAAGIDPIAAHIFVFYFATISVITPPVCVAVFVGSGIAKTNWIPSAVEAVRLGAVTYVLPFLMLLYPGLRLQGGLQEILEGCAAGLALVIALPVLLSNTPIFGRKVVDFSLLILVLIFAIFPTYITPYVAFILILGVTVIRNIIRKDTV